MFSTNVLKSLWRTPKVFHIEFPQILKGLQVKTIKLLDGINLYLINVVCVMDCRHHHASHAHVQVYFELLCRCILT